MKSKFIVKIQMPIAGENDYFVYNKNRSVMAILPVTEEIKEFMNGELKKFAYAKYQNPKAKYTLLEILGEAPWQNW